MVQMAPRIRNRSGTFMGIFRAARPEKNAPMIGLIFGGSLLMGGHLEVSALTIASVTMLIGGALTTHINVLTDADLDRWSKPHLLSGLRQHWKMSRAVIVCEAVVTMGGLTVLVLDDRSGAATMLGIGICLAVLYSYNFFARDPVKQRFKATWWTHAIVFLGGYFVLWLTGALCSPPDHHDRFWRFWPLMASASMSDYGLALSESSFDAHEERQHGLRTTAALLGARRTASLAAALPAATIGPLIVLSPGMPEAKWAFLPSALLALISTLAVVWSLRDDRANRHTSLPDLAFFAGRFYLVVALTFIRQV